MMQRQIKDAATILHRRYIAGRPEREKSLRSIEAAMHRHANTPAGPRKLPKFDQTDAARQAELAMKEAEIRRMLEMDKPSKKRDSHPLMSRPR